MSVDEAFSSRNTDLKAEARASAGFFDATCIISISTCLVWKLYTFVKALEMKRFRVLPIPSTLLLRVQA